MDRLKDVNPDEQTNNPTNLHSSMDRLKGRDSR